ncbi:MAG: DUF788 domain-containing protein [Methanobrevibacter sp.]|uniref:DUF788 domain-containing protein n=1 Tax=Methanobrevibacter sp. TaxID=66852 RepID=UPI0026E04A85|nr:DUF788 domain-containing protein [Methanobrevibacter sp.]MDO5849007.1 DUF788 domain-containing protein [Methanobrevibacter sp.]
MISQKTISSILLILSTLAILYALIFPISVWMVYAIAIICIPLWILCLGLVTMAKPRKGDKEGRVKEPFTGY